MAVHTVAAPAPEEENPLEVAGSTNHELNWRAHRRALKAPCEEAPEYLDKEAIRAAAVSGLKDAELHVSGIHGHRHDLKCAPDRERFIVHRGILSDLVERTDAQRRGVQRKLAVTYRFIAEAGDRVPWTRFEKLRLVVFIVLAIAAMGVGINQLRILLFASGYFETNLDATLFSLLPIGIAAVIESLDAFMPTDRARRTYVWLVHGCALVAGALFCWLLVLQYGDGLGGAAMAAAADSGFDDVDFDAVGADEVAVESVRAWVGVWLLRAAIAGEVFVSASLFIAASSLCAQHTPLRPTRNPMYRALEKVLSQLSRKHTVASDLLGQFEDRIKQIDTGRQLYIDEALTQFHLARSARENTAIVSDHLRGGPRRPEYPLSDQAEA